MVFITLNIFDQRKFRNLDRDLQSIDICSPTTHPTRGRNIRNQETDESGHRV
jgi:hypothetical protein